MKNHEELFEEALAIHKIGDIELAQHKYKIILKHFPNDAKSLHYYGLSFYQKENYNEALTFFNQSIDIDANEAKVFANRGNTLFFIRDYINAIKDYDKALLLNPHFSLVYFNKGTLYLEIENFLEAKICLEACLKIDEENHEALINLGIVLNYLNDNKLSKEKYDKAINLKPDFAEAYSNRGLLNKKIGNIKLAIQDFKYGLKLNKNYKTCFNNLYSILVQINDTNSLNLDEINYSSFIENDLLSSMYSSINSFLLDDLLLASSKLERSNVLMTQDNFSLLNEENKKFILGFLKFIKTILNQITPDLDPQNCSSLYHIGDSHCLSYAHRKIKINQNDYKIIPKICFGIKAFHLAQKQNNQYKSILKYHALKIPSKKIIFISIGEIDCRLDEGFIRAVNKKNLSLEKTIKDTVKNYLQFIYNLFKNNNNIIYILNVPAPKFKGMVSKKDRDDLINVINQFNFFLEHYVKFYNFNLIDIYQLTSNELGFSNNVFHCDDIHIGHNIISEIEKNYTK